MVPVPRERSRSAGNTSFTSPTSRYAVNTPSSFTAMPALSWPRCWRAYRA